MKNKLPAKFFYRDTRDVAKELIGCFLVMEKNGKVIREKITETEAYHGPHDKASHAYKGTTKRNEPMFAEPGTLYVYLIYGMYHCLNISTVEKNFPSAVLIRATENAQGPGKLCRLLNIDRSFSGRRLGKKTGLWIENKYKREPIYAGKRVGIEYAEVWAHKKWRYSCVPLTKRG